MINNKDTLKTLFSSLLIAVALGGILFAVAIGRIDYALRGLIIALPCMFAAIFFNKFDDNSLNFNNVCSTFKLNHNILFLSFILFYFLSIIVLLTNFTRGFSYFFLLVLIDILLLIQIFTDSFSIKLILCELVFTALNSIYGVTLKYPLYFGGTDLMPHLFLSDVIILLEKTAPSDLSIGYAYFPLYHIFISETTNILGLDLQFSFFLILGIISSLSILFVYLIAKSLSQNEQLSILSCLLYSASVVVVYYNMYMVTRTMAFIGFLILLYLLFKNTSYKLAPSFKILSILLAVFLLLVHQVSLPQMLILLFLLLLCDALTSTRQKINTSFFTLLSVSLFGYWLYVAYLFTQYVLATRAQKNYYEHLIINPSIEAVNYMSYIYGHLDVPITLFFILIGIGFVLISNRCREIKSIGLFSLITLVLYIPNPIQLLWQTMNLFRFDRFALLLSPFMSFIMAIGVVVFYKFISSKYNSKLAFMIILISFSVFSFTSLIYSAPESNLPLTDSPKDYFSSEELQGFDFIFNHVTFGSAIHSDYYTSRYFIQSKFNESDKLNLPYYTNYGINDINELNQTDGFIVLRSKDYEDSGLLFGYSSRYLYEYTEENTELMESSLSGIDKIYSAPSIDLYSNIIYT